jgi:hypothetical protein
MLERRETAAVSSAPGMTSLIERRSTIASAAAPLRAAVEPRLGQSLRRGVRPRAPRPTSRNR